MFSDKRYTKIVNIIGWCIFFVTTLVYILTMYPTIAFWDSSEFILSANNLTINHQPGSPLYQIIGSLVTNLWFGDARYVAVIMNALSAVVSGLSIMLIYHIFLYLFNKYSDKPVGNVFAAVISALIFAFTDTFWSQATSAEVYGFAFLFITLIILITIRYEEEPKDKYLVLLAFMLGMGYCVHPLVLLIVPAVVFIIFFHYNKITFSRIFYAILISIVALVIVIYLFPLMLSFMEMNCSITLIVSLAIISAFVFAGYFFHNRIFYLIGFCIIFFFIGLTPYIVIGIRSLENLPNNEYAAYSPKDMKNYISRSSYIHPPILYGPYYTALPPDSLEVKNDKLSPVFSSRQKTFFPRMWNYTSSAYEDGYVSWVGNPKDTIVLNGEQRSKPSFVQNLQFFASYQLNYMYIRYLLWNFCGRSNDMQGYGDITNGTWQSGYYYADRIFGINDGRTQWSKDNRANNRYFAIPLLLCLIGLLYHIIKDSKRFLFVGTIFLMYSLALVVYLNMAAYEPRERDYVYLPSFMAISLWIGIGILGVSQIIANIIRIKKPRYILPLFLFVPIWMFIQNVDDHNHRHQYTARNFAINILSSCDKDAILFVDADNDTYPLWYMQDVEKFRQDVRVINRSLLNNFYYISLLTKAAPNNKPVNLSFTPKDYKDGIMDEVQVEPSYEAIDVKEMIEEIKHNGSDDTTFYGHIKHLYHNKLFLDIGTKRLKFNIEDAAISKSDAIILDIIANNKERPMYFSAYSNDNFLGLDEYLSLEGLVYRLNDENHTSKSYDKIMHNFSFYKFDKDIYFDETERYIINFTMEQIASTAYSLLVDNEKTKAIALIDYILEKIPPNIHSYPYALANMSLVRSAVSNDDVSMDMLEHSIDYFQSYLYRYNNGTQRYQRETRLNAMKAISFFINMCYGFENFALERGRREISNAFFSVIRPYMLVTYRQKHKMEQNMDYYSIELEDINNLLSQVRDFAEYYEEDLPNEDEVEYDNNISK